MTITSSQIVEDSSQADGRRFLTMKFTFHTGEVVQLCRKVGSAYDEQVGLTLEAAKQENQIIDREDSNLYSKILTGQETEVVEAVIAHPETISLADRRKRFHRKLVRWAMQEQDIKGVRRLLYALWYYLKYTASYTPQQIANYFDVTLAQLKKFDDRMTALSSIVTTLDGDDAYVVDLKEVE